MVTHRAGKHNVNPDLISRAHHMSEPTPSVEGTITQNTDRILPEYCPGCQVMYTQLWNNIHPQRAQVEYVW